MPAYVARKSCAKDNQSEHDETDRAWHGRHNSRTRKKILSFLRDERGYSATVKSLLKLFYSYTFDMWLINQDVPWVSDLIQAGLRVSVIFAIKGYFMGPMATRM